MHEANLSYRTRDTRRGEQGVALVEFAVTLPLMMLLVVGLFDFGSAFDVKQKLNNAAQAGARYAASQPTFDLNNTGTPNSVLAVRNVIDAYLVAEKVNDCGLGGSSGIPSAGLMWTFKASGNGCAGEFDLSIERSVAIAAGGGVNVNVICTRVFMTYHYPWQFGKVIGLVTPGATFNAGAHTIGATALAPNMD
jgi:Flp pilus assembly protein TadG